jgi:hypothetical protein
MLFGGSGGNTGDTLAFTGSEFRRLILTMQPKLFKILFWFLYLGTVYISQALQLTEAWFIFVYTSPPQPHFTCIYVVTAASMF